MNLQTPGLSGIGISSIGLGNVEKNLDAVDGLKHMADEHGTKPAHLALQWFCSQPGVGSVIAGGKSNSVDTYPQNLH